MMQKRSLDNQERYHHHIRMTSISHYPPPTSEAQLQERAAEIAGQKLGSIANELNINIPANLRQHKGWVGQLLEARLGADAASQAEPDFRTLGVELKTIPVDHNGRPRESTYVCTVPMDGNTPISWESSWIKRKLSRVLWLPVEAESGIPLAERRVGSALLWSPSSEEEAILQSDWEELMDMVIMGGVEQLSARLGEVLQIRPKAANSRVACRATGEDGAPIFANPRGFYLRSSFTGAILNQHYVIFPENS